MTFNGIAARDWAETVELRGRLHANGWHLVPVNEKEKAPVFVGWPKYVYNPEDPEPAYPRTKNSKGTDTAKPHLGTGAITTGTVAIDLDIDCPDRAAAARRAFEAVADPSCIVRYRVGSPRKMLFYAPGEGVDQISTSFGTPEAKIEIFANHQGRQVMINGTHPSGAVLEYEGDEPADWRLSDLPKLNRATLNAAFAAALKAAHIETDGKTIEHNPGGVRRQVTTDDATAAIANSLRQIFSGESVHRASNNLADLLAFQLGLDGEQAARIIAATASAAEALNPAESDRYRELAAKSQSRAHWYAQNAEQPPTENRNLRFWRNARVAQLKRAWRVLPPDLRAVFLETAVKARGTNEAPF